MEIFTRGKAKHPTRKIKDAGNMDKLSSSKTVLNHLFPRQMLSSLDVLENKMIFFLSKLLVIWANRQVSTLEKKKKRTLLFVSSLGRFRLDSREGKLHGLLTTCLGKEHHTGGEAKELEEEEEVRDNTGSKHYKRLERFHPFVKEELRLITETKHVKNQAEMERETWKHIHHYV